MKVAELEGALLDLWVARAENVGVYADSHGDMWEGNRTYRPSSDWARGGTIIERERIFVECRLRKGEVSAWGEILGPLWRAGIVMQWHIVPGEGATPLIAAMRAYVASKFGDEVPDTLESGPSGSV